MRLFFRSFSEGLDDTGRLFSRPVRFGRVFLFGILGLLAGALPQLYSPLGYVQEADFKALKAERRDRLWTDAKGPGSLDDITSGNTPIEILSLARQNLKDGKYREAAVAAHMASGAFEYDINRLVPNLRDHDDAVALTMGALRIDDETTRAFLAERFGDGRARESDIAEAVRRLKESGPPERSPKYLLNPKAFAAAGIDLGKLGDDELLAEVDNDALWSETLDTLSQGLLDTGMSHLMADDTFDREAMYFVPASVYIHAVPIGFAALVLLIILLRVNAFFRFIYYEAVVSPEVHDGEGVRIKGAKQRWGRQVNSYFRYNLLSVMAAAAVAVGVHLLLSAIGDGFDVVPGEGVGGAVLKDLFSDYLGVGAGLFALGIFTIYIEQFGTAIMAIENTTVWGAFVRLIRLFFSSPIRFLLYLPFSLAVSLGVNFLAGIVSTLLLLGLSVPLGALFFLIYVLTESTRIVLAAILIGGVPLALFLVLLVMSAGGLVFRMFSLRYLGHIAPQYNALADVDAWLSGGTGGTNETAEEGAEGEGVLPDKNPTRKIWGRTKPSEKAVPTNDGGEEARREPTETRLPANEPKTPTMRTKNEKAIPSSRSGLTIILTDKPPATKSFEADDIYS